MNSTQRRLHSYRRHAPLGDVGAPELARGRRPIDEGGRSRLDLVLGGMHAEASIPKHPSGWIVTLGSAEPELERTSCATVRIALPVADPTAALVAAVGELHRLPEARGLGVAIAGFGVHAEAAQAAASALGGAIEALVLDRYLAGPLCLTPTLADAELDPAAIDDFLAEELPARAHALDGRRRRLLSRRLERRLRRDCRRRGALTGRVRAGLAGLASALAFTLSLGLGVQTAGAAFEATWNTTGTANQIVLDDTASAHSGVTVECDTGPSPAAVRVNGAVIPIAQAPLYVPCGAVKSITVTGNNGNDTMDLSAVDDADFTSINGVTIDGGTGEDVILGARDAPDGVLDDGGADGAADTITGGSQNDLFVVSDGDDSLSGGGSSDTLDQSATSADLNVDLDASSGSSKGDGNKSLLGIESAFTGSGKDEVIAGSASSRIEGNGGPDLIQGPSLGFGTLLGGPGEDEISGAPFSDIIEGGADDDDLDGNGGVDDIDGNGGDDTLEGSDTVGDNLDGGADTDRVNFSTAPAAVDIDLLNGTAVSGGQTDTLTSIEQARGSNNADTIDGTNGADTLFGLSGDDTINGLSGDDQIQGGNDADSINGGALDDTVFGQAGDDTITSSEDVDGGTDNDRVTLGTGLGREAVGGAGDDLLRLLAAGTLSGDAGEDTLQGSSSADSLVAGGDADEVDAGDGDDTVLGEAGDDTVAGDQGADDIDGGDDEDTLTGFTGADTIAGGLGNDTIEGDQDADELSGGGGTLDRVVQTANADQDLDDDALTGEGPDVISGFERASISASSGDDLLDASDWTGDGVTISASSGDDTVLGGAGSDSLVGGVNADRIVDTGGSLTIEDTLLTGNGNDTIDSFSEASLSGSGLPDLLDASDFGGSVTLAGAGANDTLRPNTDGEHDSIIGGAGVLDRVEATSNGSKTLTDALLTGPAGNETLSGIESASLGGGATGESLDASGFTETGGVTLDGDDGSDTLLGSSGNDSLIGGGGTQDRAVQTGGDQTVTDSQLTGDGTDALSGVERASLTGSAAADSLSAAGFTGQATLAGEGGDDTLRGGSGNDSMLGGGATDRLFQAAGSATLSNSLITGDGTDNLSSIDEAYIAGDSAANALDASAFSGGPVTLVGEGSNDTLEGTADDDSLDGGPGLGDRLETSGIDANQTITDSQFTSPLAGTDDLDNIELASLVGGASDNVLNASSFSGDVTISALDGDDTVLAGAGDDSLTGGYSGETNGDRLVMSSNAASQTLANTGATVAGTDSHEFFEEVSITGGAGANSIDASAVTVLNVTLAGGAGSDILEGGNQEDLLQGDGDDDELDGGGSADTLQGGADDDTLAGGGDDDSIVGGGGGDRVAQSVNASQTLTNSSLTGQGNDELVSIEQASLEGGSGGNVLDATGFDPAGGMVTLSAGDGIDTLRGSPGADSLDGGTGGIDNDRVEQTANADQTLTNGFLSGDGGDQLADIERVSLTGGAGANELDAGAFSGLGVTIDGAGGNDSITASAGTSTDSLIGSGGDDRLVKSADVADLTLTDTQVGVFGTGDDLSGFEEASVSGGNSANDLDASGFSGETTLFGSGGSDTVIGSPQDDSLRGGTGLDTLFVDSGGDVTLTSSQVTGDGTDTLGGDFGRVEISGDASANEVVAAGFPAPIRVFGNNGDDTIEGGDANDTLLGGGGTDAVRQTADGSQTLTSDQLTGNGTDSLGSGQFEQASLTGGTGADDIDASAATTTRVSLVGLGGNDTLADAGPSDTLAGGSGNDRLETTDGDDSLVGGADTDLVTHVGGGQTLTNSQLVSPGQGTKDLVGVEEASLRGGPSGDALDASAFTAGSATLSGEGGDDTIEGGSGDDQLLGGSEFTTDRIVQSANANQTLSDSQATGRGTDAIGGFERASLEGGASANAIDASGFTESGTHTIAGGGGDDTISPAGGRTDVDGEGGTDRVSVSSNTATITLTNSELSRGNPSTDPLSSIEEASIAGGASSNDILSTFTGPTTLSGGGSNDSIDAGAGPDLLEGGDSSDTIFGGPGAEDDTLVGGGGGDELSGGGETTGDVVVAEANSNMTLSDDTLSVAGDNDDLASIERASLTGGVSANTLEASGFTQGPVSLDGLGGADSLVGSPQSDDVAGGAEDDTLQGGQGNDSLDGGPGTDLGDYSDIAVGINADLGAGTVQNASTDQVSLENLLGTAQDDTLAGDGAANDLDGAGGADTITGAGGDDTLRGSGGADLLGGGLGLDQHFGGTETDTLNTADGLVDVNDCGPGAADVANDDDIDSTNATCETRNSADTTEPETTLDTGPTEGATINTDSATFTFSSNEGGSTFTCQLDAGPTEACNSGSKTYTGLSQGNHTFTVFATDPSSNADPTPATRNFTVDSAPPQTTINSGPANGSTIATKSATFGFASSESGSTFSCRLDGGPVEACNSGSKTYNNLSEGNHTFRVFATDPNSNADPTPATRSFTVDTSDPPPVDNTAPDVRVSGRKKQKSSKKVVVKVTCSEACDIKAKGKVKAKLPKKGKKKLKLKTVRTSAAENKRVKLKLKVKGRKNKKILKKALKSGKTSKAKIRVIATDAAGNRTTEKRRVKLKKKKRKK